MSTLGRSQMFKLNLELFCETTVNPIEKYPNSENAEKQKHDPSRDDVELCEHMHVSIFILCGRTTKITRLPPSDFDFRKRPTGNSGAFFGYPTSGDGP